MISLFTSHIRPMLEYCSSVWNLGFEMDIRKMESLQRKWTKCVEGFQSLTYAKRLETLNLFYVRGRLVMADLIKIWKIFHGVAPGFLLAIFDENRHASTRGHRFKLAMPKCRLAPIFWG